MTFWQLTVPVSADTSDGLTNFLWEAGALGVVEEESPTEPARLRAFFPDTASSTELLAKVTVYRASLKSLGFPMDPQGAEIAPLHDGDWAHAWQQSFPPREVGKRLLIVPPWDARPDSETCPRVQVIIEPGRAFGTGHHGSTEGCLALLDEALSSGAGLTSPMLDIGTGTGILSIAAVKLGAPRAVGIDMDPDAISASRLNAEKNGCADRIALLLQGADEPVPGEPSFRLIVANLLTHTHLALAKRYERLVAPGGSLILGGILAEEHQVVADALCARSFEMKTCRFVDGWASLLVALPARP
jgi:ribosomal protein L11 methyltransferase